MMTSIVFQSVQLKDIIRCRSICLSLNEFIEQFSIFLFSRLLHIASPVFALDVLAFASRPKQKLLERNAYKRLDSPLPGI